MALLDQSWARALLAMAGIGVWLSIMAAIFIALEVDAERDRNSAAVADFDAALAQRNATLQGLRALMQGNAEALANLTALEDQLDSLAGGRPSEGVRDWTFIGSLYYSYTLVTTIGYGTFAPQTDGGQALTLLLGLIGIAIYTVALTQVSVWYRERIDSMAKALIRLSSSGRANREATARLETRRAKAASVGLTFIIVWLVGAELYRELIVDGGEENAYDGDEGITYWHAIYYSGVTFLTIGLGDYSVPWHGPDEVASVLLFIFLTGFGLVAFASLINLLIGDDDGGESGDVQQEAPGKELMGSNAGPPDRSSQCARKSQDGGGMMASPISALIAQPWQPGATSRLSMGAGGGVQMAAGV